MMTRNEQGKGHCFYIYSFKLTREVRIFLKKYNSFFEENRSRVQFAIQLLMANMIIAL